MNRNESRKSRSLYHLRYYTVIYLGGLRKTMKNLGQDNRSPGWNLKPEPHKHEAVLTTPPRRSVYRYRWEDNIKMCRYLKEAEREEIV